MMPYINMTMKITLSVTELHSLASVSIIVLQSDMAGSNARYSFQEGTEDIAKLFLFFGPA